MKLLGSQCLKAEPEGKAAHGRGLGRSQGLSPARPLPPAGSEGRQCIVMRITLITSKSVR